MLSHRFKLGTYFDVGLYLHWSFFLLPAFLGYREWSNGGDALGVALTVLLVLLIFTCVILHEYGHVLAARAFGISTRDITMLPIGGVARLERMPEEPWQELIVAVAGPAVNVVIAITLGIGLVLVEMLGSQMHRDSLTFAHHLYIANVILVVFNMVPAFPMDGGRVFRSIASMFVSHLQATRWAMRLGQVLAVVLGFYGLRGESPFLPFLAIFIFWVGTMEYRQVEITSHTKGMLVRDCMVTRFETVDLHEDLVAFTRRAASHLQQVFPVVEQGILRGTIELQQLASSMDRAPNASRVSDVMRRGTMIIHEGERLQDVLLSLPRRSPQVPVVDHANHVVGLLDPETCLRRIALQNQCNDALVPSAPQVDRVSPESSD